MALTRILGTRTLLVSALTLSLAACMGGGTQQAAVPDCTFPDAPEKAAPGGFVTNLFQVFLYRLLALPTNQLLA